MPTRLVHFLCRTALYCFHLYIKGVPTVLKKTVLLLITLLFAVGSHLRPCCDYTLGGVPIAAGFAPGTARQAELTVRDAAEEILREGAPLPAFQKHTRLRFKRPSEDMRVLTDALLRATDGIVRRDEVRVEGVRLGWVADGEALREALHEYITNTLPAWASDGVLSRELGIRRLYTRDGYLTAQSDMVLLVTGAAPVFYYDQTGRYARA